MQRGVAVDESTLTVDTSTLHKGQFDKNMLSNVVENNSVI
jgi:hypothetical protein